jgi:LysR family transcriptional regulator, low CO2-responsive transcriptional regulator
MNFTLHQLQIYLKVVQYKSITKAANELFLTQPAVSIQLKMFQNQFDIPLTEVIGRKLYVTDFGKEVAESAEKILNEVYTISNKTHTYKGQLIGKLKISVVSTGKYVIPYLLSDFIKQNSSVELILDVTNKTKVLEDLENNEVDFSLMSVLPNNPNLDYEELLENKLFLVGSKMHEPYSTIQDEKIFEKLPMIFREKGSGTRYFLENYWNKNSISVRIKMELTSNEAVKQALIAGLGYSVLPLIGIKNEIINGDLKIIPVKGFPVSSFWYLVWSKNKKFSPVAAAYLEYIRENKEIIIEKHFDWFKKFNPS